MDSNTVGLIIAGVLGAFGIGGAGGRFLLGRNNEEQPQQNFNENTNPGIDTTGQHKALEMVAESIVKTSDEIKASLHDTKDKLGELVITTIKLESKLETMPTLIENATMKAMGRHESKLHGDPAPKRNLKMKKVG